MQRLTDLSDLFAVSFAWSISHMGKSAVSASTAKQGFQFNVVFKQGKI